jgi:predicted membrane metal-binding protein
MSKKGIIIMLGVLVALMPFLGFPHAWESLFQIVFGLAIVLLSVWSTIDKHLTLKAKAQKRQVHKRRQVEIVAQHENDESSSTFSGNQ